jgi:hypothetical protein
MSTSRKPIYIRHVAATFVATFALVAFFLSHWYEPSVLLQEPIIRFAWAGTAYLFAYAVTEFVRKPGFFSALGLCGGVLLLAFDIARHSQLIIQLSEPFGPPFIPAHLWLTFSACTAAAASDSLLCKAIEPMYLNPAVTLGFVAGLLVLPMVYKLLTLRTTNAGDHHDRSFPAVLPRHQGRPESR